MGEGTRTALLDKEQTEEGFVKRAVAAAEEAPPKDRVRAGLERAIEFAESDPLAARSALRRLRGDYQALSQVESWIDGDPDRVTFGLGAAIQTADAELAKSAPDLRRRMPELMRWLEGDW